MYDIIITTKKIQNKKHKKKRINKKWAKRYGYTVYEVQRDQQIILINNKVYMTEAAYNNMLKCNELL